MLNDSNLVIKPFQKLDISRTDQAPTYEPGEIVSVHPGKSYGQDYLVLNSDKEGKFTALKISSESPEELSIEDLENQNYKGNIRKMGQLDIYV